MDSHKPPKIGQPYESGSADPGGHVATRIPIAGVNSLDGLLTCRMQSSAGGFASLAMNDTGRYCSGESHSASFFVFLSGGWGLGAASKLLQVLAAIKSCCHLTGLTSFLSRSITSASPRFR